MAFYFLWTVLKADALEFGHLPLQVYTAANTGLPMDYTGPLAFDRDGRLWVGTQEGAACFDGSTWTLVSLPRPARSNWPLCILSASDGSLWFGTYGDGLYRYQHGRWTSHTPDQGFPDTRVNALVEAPGPDGRPVIWAGTNDHGLWGIREDGSRMDGGGSLGRVLSLLAAPAGLWAGTDHGLYLRAGTFWTGFQKGRSGLPDDTVHCLAPAPGGLWIGTSGGLARLEGQRWTVFKAGLPSPVIKALAPLPDGTLWAGTTKGLVRWDRGRFDAFGSGAGLPNPVIQNLMAQQAPGGPPALWVATPGGLVQLNPGKWTSFRRSPGGLPENHVFAILESFDLGPVPKPPRAATTSGGMLRKEGPAGRCGSSFKGADAAERPPDVVPPGWGGGQSPAALGSNRVEPLCSSRLPCGEPPGAPGAPSAARGGFGTGPLGKPTLWFGTYGGGLASLSEGKWRVIQEVAGHPMTAVRCLYETRAKELWAGTFRQGLFRRRGGRWERVPTPPALARAEWRQMVELPGGLWAATSEGLACLKGDRWQVWTAADGLPHGDINRILETRTTDGRDLLWVGTVGGGVGRLEGGKWTSIGPAQGLDALWIMDLFPGADAQGRPQILVATSGGGIWTLDLDGRPGRPEVPAPREGTVYGLQRDAQGRLYAFTAQGVARFVPGQPGLETFTTGDGLPHNDCNLGASMVDRAGRIWTGTAGGAAVFDPEAYLPDRSSKPLHLTTSLPSRDGLPAPGLVLPHNENSIRFELSLVSFVREGDTRYRTQLVGLEAEPGPWRAEPVAEYPRLPAGTYVFKAWARDHAGNLSGPVSFPWRVRPAPWLTPWAFGAYGGLLGFGFFGLLRLRTRLLARRNRELEGRVQAATRELEALNQEKNEFIALVAHDLKNPLSLIQQLSGGLLRGEIAGCPEASRPWLEMVSAAARDMSALIHRVLNVNALESGDLAPTFEPVDVALLTARQIQAFLAKAERKQVHLDVEGLPEALWARTDGPYVQQIIDNLLSNAIKFSPPGGTVWIRGRVKGKMAVLEVQDQGPGLTPEDKLRLFQRFAQLSARPTGDESSCGLGLSIAKRLVEILQGWIHVESEVGKGSTFRVELPAA